jgi:hypothetical protein
MLNAIRHFEPRVAAGLLAQAALHLEHPMGELEKPLVENQQQIESSILIELRAILGISPDDHSESALEALSDALDEQTDAVGQFDREGSIERLSAEGLLPSDVYDIVFQPHLPENFKWRWEIESTLATQTIRRPHREQVLGAPGQNDDDAPKVTLFARYFVHKYPARSFWLLVAGSREGKQLQIAQIWRIYTQDIDLTQSETLLDVLKAFADRFGYPANYGGKLAKFFYRLDVADAPPERNFRLAVAGGRPEAITVTAFHPPADSGRYVFLLVPINLTSYFKQVDNWHGWDKDLLENLRSVSRSAPSANIAPQPWPT